jgi:uncharacterized membrane protein YphA (DoxX/SURF4 family)
MAMAVIQWYYHASQGVFSAGSKAYKGSYGFSLTGSEVGSAVAPIIHGSGRYIVTTSLFRGVLVVASLGEGAL